MPRTFTVRSTHTNAGIAALTTLKTVGNAEVHSYEDAECFLGGLSFRKIASNVMIFRNSPTTISVKLYQTDIVTYHKDGTFTAQNGGFNTPTTSARAQQFGPRNTYFYHHKKILHPTSGKVKAA